MQQMEKMFEKIKRRAIILVKPQNGLGRSGLGADVDVRKLSEEHFSGRINLSG